MNLQIDKQPIHLQTGTPAAPFWYERIRFIPCDKPTLSHGCVPGLALFEAAIGVYWSENCRSLRGQYAFSSTSPTVSPQSPDFEMYCELDASLHCKSNYETHQIGCTRTLPSASASQSLTGNCVWDVNQDTCHFYLSIPLTGYPATGIDQSECAAWTVSAGHTNFHR